MTEMRDRTGTRRRYEDFAGDAQWLEFAGITVRVAGLKDIIASKLAACRSPTFYPVDTVKAPRRMGCSSLATW